MTVTAMSFSALVLAVSLMLVAAIRAAFDRSSAATVLGAAAVAAWLGVTAMLADSGLLTDFSARPPTFVRIMGLCALTCVLLVLSPLGRRLALGVPLGALIGMQVFRLPVELLLHRLHLEGLAPVQMTYLGRNVDVVTALLALPTAYLVAARGERDRLARRLALAFNVIGMGTLVNIVVVAILSVPGPLRVFLNEPANTFVTALPYVWLPTVLVLTALLGHLLVFRRLAAGGARMSAVAGPLLVALLCVSCGSGSSGSDRDGGAQGSPLYEASFDLCTEAFLEARANGCGSQDAAYCAPEARRAVVTDCHAEQVADRSCVLHALEELGCNFRDFGANCDAEFHAMSACEEAFCAANPSHPSCVCSAASGTIFDDGCW